MKEFNLKHALKTRTAKDTNGNAWELEHIELGNSKLIWNRRIGASKVVEYGETDLDGKVMHGWCSDLFSAEVEKTTQTFYLIKNTAEDRFSFAYGEHDYPQLAIRYELNLNLEDGEIKSINHEKVRG